MTPSKRYQKLVKSQQVESNPLQQQLLPILDTLHQQLCWRHQWWHFYKKKRKFQYAGLYLWGSVGSGKTFLCDLLLANFSPKKVMRVHFHAFMRDIHQQLQQQQHQKNPLKKIVKNIAEKNQLLFIDEFFVVDIGDAMILAALLKEIVRQKIVVLLTSNIDPTNLYENGLQRQRFLPTIALIQQRFAIFNLSTEDFRQKYLSSQPRFFYGKDANDKLAQLYYTLTGLTQHQPTTLTVNKRTIQCQSIWKNYLWCSFEQLCDGPRSQADYLALTEQFQCVFLSEVPQLNSDDTARRFVYLVDAMYDQKIRLVTALACPLEQIYGGTRLQLEMERTKSRLMQGTDQR